MGLTALALKNLKPKPSMYRVTFAPRPGACVPRRLPCGLSPNDPHTNRPRLFTTACLTWDCEEQRDMIRPLLSLSNCPDSIPPRPRT